MGIDKETKPSGINIVLDNNQIYMKNLKAQAETDGQNEEGKNCLSVTDEKHVFQTEEYYFDEHDNTITINGQMVSDAGSTWVSINIPLSDIVLIDIMQYAVKKLNKLKTALETLGK